MKIGVLLKIVPDTETKIKIKTDNSGINNEGIKWIINPYDEYALEAALQLKEKLSEQKVEIVVVSAGPKKFTEAQATIKKALARGADRPVYLANDIFAKGDSYITAKALTKTLKEESFDIIFTGKQGMDYDNSQVPQLISGMLDIPCITNVSKFEFKEGKVVVEREVGSGTKEKWELPIPCITGITKSKEFEPRSESLKGIMRVKGQEIKENSIPDPPDQMIKTEVIKFESSPKKQAGKIVQSVEELAKALREEAKVI